MRYNANNYTPETFISKFQALLDDRYKHLEKHQKRNAFIKAYDQKYNTVNGKQLNSIDSTVKQWFIKKQKPSLEKLMNICELLDCDIDYFLTSQADTNKDIAAASETTRLNYHNIEFLTQLNNNNIQMLNLMLSHKDFSTLLSSCWSYLHSKYNQLLLFSSPYHTDFRFTEDDADKIYKFSATDTFSIMIEDMYSSHEKQALIEYEQSLILEIIDCVQNYQNGFHLGMNKTTSIMRFEHIQEQLQKIQSVSPYATISFDELDMELKANPIDKNNLFPSDAVYVISKDKNSILYDILNN